MAMQFPWALCKQNLQQSEVYSRDSRPFDAWLITNTALILFFKITYL